MNTLTKSSEHRKFNNPLLRDFLDVDDAFNNWMQPFGRSLPAVNIAENEKAYTVDVVAPGFCKEDFKINVEDDILIISAKNEKESKNGSDNTKYNRQEYSYSSFTRSFRLPDNAKDDAITANYKDGVLKLQIEKSANPVKATKEIAVQ